MDKQIAKADATQSQSRDVLILVVDDDHTSQAVVSGMLRTWKYRVETVRNGVDALATLRSKGDKRFDLVLTDVHMPAMDGFELIKIISTEFQIPIVMMSADEKEHTMVKGLECGAVYFIHKPLRPEDLQNLWQYAIPKRNLLSSSQPVIDDANALVRLGGSSDQAAGPADNVVQFSLVPAATEDQNLNSTIAVLDHEKSHEVFSRKRKQLNESKQKQKNYNDALNNYLGSTLHKKQKVAWSTGLHNKFLDALKIIGLDRAVPKKILEVMDVPGLTRENVASHLQKYRLFLKRVADVAERPDLMGLNRTNRSKFASLHYGFQLEHLDISDDNVLRKRLKQELRAMRDPLHMTSSWSLYGPTLSNSSPFALQPREFPNNQMPVVFGQRLMGAAGGMSSGTNQLTFGNGSEQLMHQAAPLSNNFDMSGNASGNNGPIMDNTNVNCQNVVSQQPPSGWVHNAMNNIGVSELQTGGAVTDSTGPYTSNVMENSTMMPQEAIFGNATMQYNMNPPSQPLELPNVNDAGHTNDMSNKLVISGIQPDFSEFLMEQPPVSGDQTFSSLEQAGSDFGNPYINFSSYTCENLQNNIEESGPIPNQQFDEGSNVMHTVTANIDAPYSGDDFQPWFDEAPIQTQPENQNTNMVLADELIAMYQDFEEDVLDSRHVGGSKRNNES